MKIKSINQDIERSGIKSSLFISLIIFILLFGYAVLRYNILRDPRVSLSSIPLYISNKAIAVASVFLIGLSYLLGSLARFWPSVFSSKLHLRKYFGLLGFGLASIHGIISLLLFNPAYYPRFFIEAGKLTLVGELSMLFGVLGLGIFTIVAVSSIPSVEQSMNQKKWLAIQRLGYLALILVILHVFVMGYKGWLNPSDWPGGFLPMSLIAFIVIALVLLVKILAIAHSMPITHRALRNIEDGHRS